MFCENGKKKKSVKEVWKLLCAGLKLFIRGERQLIPFDPRRGGTKSWLDGNHTRCPFVSASDTCYTASRKSSFLHVGCQNQSSGTPNWSIVPIEFMKADTYNMSNSNRLWQTKKTRALFDGLREEHFISVQGLRLINWNASCTLIHEPKGPHTIIFCPVHYETGKRDKCSMHKEYYGIKKKKKTKCKDVMQYLSWTKKHSQPSLRL